MCTRLALSLIHIWMCIRDRAKGIEVIFDDRKKVSPGVKFKDAELIGVPIIAVAGRDTVNNGTIEVRDRNGENAEAVPVADAAQAIADRVAALLK